MPALQPRQIVEAIDDGFAFARKGNDEIAVGFRPDNLLSYALNCETLHEYGADAIISDLLTKVGRFEVVQEEELAALPVEPAE